MQQLLERTDAGFSQPHTINMEADTWRSLFKSRSAECINYWCLVNAHEDGCGGRVYAYSEFELNSISEKVFQRFQPSKIQSENGLHWVDFRPRVS